MSVQQTIHDKLVDALAPAVLEVINESHMHSGPATESHFKVVVVTARFDGMPLLRRHRLVNDTLAAELGGGVHALSIHAYTPTQWQDRGGEIPRSPPCRGGSKAS
ncbi:BolA family protein [Paraliomyxa miuraensis]|uniref:BolA family protein n=1 Tax=Paraliomyxa miuraensis TaxID=376150 RepID=UPI00224CF4E8|nr:BolA family protein [Paraliomyxa miuraensis]MCX4245595.1 BolA family transcriptional regulator [Paraliomyxa miuraensis]